MRWGLGFFGAGLSFCLAAALLTYGATAQGFRQIMRLFYSMNLFPTDAGMAEQLSSLGAVGTALAALFLGLAGLCFAVAAVSFLRHGPERRAAQIAEESRGRTRIKGRV